MNRFEYEAVQVDYVNHMETVWEWAQQGWELVAVSSSLSAPMGKVDLYFKRPKLERR